MLSISLIYPIVLVGLILLLYLGSLWKPELFKKPLILFCLLTGFVYLCWRLLFTLPLNGPVNIIAGIILFITELIGFLQMCIFYTLVWKPASVTRVPLDQLDHLPTIDILIATYNEPAALLKRTIAGCLNLDYPQDLIRIYICDDGGRKNIEELAKQFAVNYIKREDHSFAKAGNLNHALAHTDGECIVTLDADMVPRSGFLQRTVGLFSDPDVAFVQTPQAFYNDDPYQFNTFSTERLPNEQDFFMRTLQAGKARFNAVMFVGSNAIFRRQALEAIGGFATGVITEDMATGMILQAKKFRTLFVGDVLALGLAPETWGDLLKQRDRWCRGNIQCARKWNPLTIKGLTFMQRLLYLDGIVYWFFGIFKVVYIIAPILYMLFGIYFLKTDLYSLICFWLPSFLASFLSFRIVSQRQRSMSWSHIYDTSMAPALAWSAISELLFRKQLQFKVTPKGEKSEKRQFQFGSVLPHLFFSMMTAAAIVKIGFDFFFFHSLQMDEVSFNLFWALYNLVGLLLSLAIAVNRPRFRSSERFTVNRPGTIILENDPGHKSVPVFIMDISDSGARILLPDGLVSTHRKFGIRAFGNEQIGKLNCKVVWLASHEHEHQYACGIQFDKLTENEYSRLINFVFNELESGKGFGEDKTGAIITLFRFTRQLFKSINEHKRKQVRHESAFEGHILRIPESNISRAALETAVSLSGQNKRVESGNMSAHQPVTILDISATGCRVRTDFALQPNETIILDTKKLEKPVRAEVRWEKKSLRHYEIGLLFV